MQNLHYSDDKSSIIKKARLINDPKNMRPHVVILGAGASVAAFPHGDAAGKILPTMDNLIDVIGLRPILSDYGVECPNQNFEELRLPDEPTMYDHLIISLRPKDIVATFNWDPFLFDAWNRHSQHLPVPDIVNLHGNVRMAFCIDHKIKGENGMYCPECDRKLTPSKLLFPIVKKNYTDDPFISSEWKLIELCLQSAFTLTIFGYGAPETDKEAFDLMTQAWIGRSQRQLETMEIIDTKEKQELVMKWKPFMPTFHCQHIKDFYKSGIMQFPRRSCEGLYVPTVLGKLAKSYPFPVEMNFKELWSWVKPLIDAELLMK